MDICAPGNYDKTNNTCFRIDQLMEMAKAYNRYINKKNVKNKNANHDFIKITKNKNYLLSELKKRFNDICQDEICITQQDFMNELMKDMREEILSDTFLPDGPAESTEWLTTTHINDILQLYEKIDKHFNFLGAVPLDCNELSFCPLYNLKFDEYYNNEIYKLAIIFNHDTYGQPGSHWVALYMDLKKGEIDFCDSTGNPPINNINNIIDKFIKWYHQKTGKNAIYHENKKAYQTDSSECGVYSINFIIRRLSGEKFDDIIKNSLNFEEINSCRNAYFRNKVSKYKINPKCLPNNKYY